MQHIIEGFLSFQKEVFPQRKDLFRSLASSQNPKALFISCSDSRLVPELVTQQDPGQLFVIRNAGNIVPPFGPEPGGVSATIEYAVVALGVTDIVICGHSNCGAMKAIADNAKLEPFSPSLATSKLTLPWRSVCVTTPSACTAGFMISKAVGSSPWIKIRKPSSPCPITRAFTSSKSPRSGRDDPP